MTLAAGTRIGPYEVISSLGAGGMGEVYRGRDTRLKRDVALKILPSAVASDHDRLARFQREAELLAAVNHPNIASIHGVEEIAASGPGQPQTLVLVMELVEGEDLAARISRGPIPVDESIAIAKQIAGALEAAHERGIVHRDLKPANIKVRPDGTVKVLDFGLAKPGATGASGASEANSLSLTSPAALTMGGMILGTAAYMSPEQARGKNVDRRADIWAFGAVFYEMLTGRRAFAGDDVSETLASVLAREPDWSLLPAGVSPTLSLFLQRCLQRDPKRRLRDVGDMLLALEGALDVAPAAVQQPPAPAVSRLRLLLPIAAAAAIAFAAGAFVPWRTSPVTPGGPTTRFDVVIPSGRTGSSGRPIIAVSADGRALAYREPEGLYLRTMSALEPRLIPGTGESRTPFFSPDGQWLGWYTTDAIKKIAIAGGEPVHLATVDGPAGASWPEPDTILFADATGIQRISARGGAPERLLAAGNGEQLNAPQLLPNGSLLFSVATGQELDRWDRAQVVVQSPASGTRTVVASKAMEPRYFAEGFITYVLGRSLVAVRFDLDRLAVVGAAVPIVDNVMGPVGVARMLMGGANYDVSPTGTLIYIPDDTPMRSLVWVNRDGTPAGPVAGIPPGYFEDPRLSPDGKRLLVTRDGDLWTYELDSGRESRVTRNGSSLMGVWNPSGTRIAYSSVADGRLEAWVTAADGSGEPRQLTRERTIVHVDSWAPDGRTLSVHRHGTNTIIQMIDVDAPDAKPRVFVDREGPAEGADFVRDGRHVVYLSMDSGRREAYIRPFPGPGGRVTVSVDGGREPRWAANGEVFYRSLDGQRMYVVGTTMSPTLTVGKPQELFRGSYYVTPTGSPRPQYDVTADGRRFVMLVPTPGKAGSGPRIVVVQNWLDELRRLLPADGR